MVRHLPTAEESELNPGGDTNCLAHPTVVNAQANPEAKVRFAAVKLSAEVVKYDPEYCCFRVQFKATTWKNLLFMFKIALGRRIDSGMDSSLTVFCRYL